MIIWILKWKGIIIEQELEIKHGIHISFDYFKCSFPLIVRREETESSEMRRVKYEIAKFFNLTKDDIHPIKFVPKFQEAYTLGDYIELRLGGPEFGNGFKSCYIELRGLGCDEFEARCPEKDWRDLLEYFVLGLDAKVKRIDIAIDDYDGNIVTFDWILDKLNRDDYSSCFKNRNFNLSGHINTGRSITFGKHGKTLMLCIYEKLKEQQSKKIECNQTYWTRFEMRFSQNRGDDFAFNFLKNSEIEFKEYVMNVFYNMLDIKDDDNDRNHNNISHAQTDKKWLEFLNNPCKYKLERSKQVEGSYVSYEEWAHSHTKKYLLYLLMTNKNELYTLFTKVIEMLIEAANETDKAKLKNINSKLSAKHLTRVRLSDVETLKNELIKILEERKLPF